MPKQRRSYTPEFRREAVNLIVERGYTYPDAATRLGIPFHTLKNWVKADRKNGSLPPVGKPLPEASQSACPLKAIFGERPFHKEGVTP